MNSENKKSYFRRFAIGMAVFAALLIGSLSAEKAEADIFDDIGDFLDPTEHFEDILEGNPFGFIGDPILNILTGTTPTLPDPDDILNPPGKPVVETKGVDDVEQTSVKLNAYVNPNGSASTNTYFQFGKTAKLGNRSRAVRVLVPSNTEIKLNKLKPCTKYFYQAIARNRVFTEKGGVKSFTTKGCAENPTPSPSTGPCTAPLTLNQVKDELQAGHIELGKPNVNNGEGVVKNNTNCPLPISLAVYTIDDPSDIQNPNASSPGANDFTHQTRFDKAVATIPPNSTHTFKVNLPKCNFQMDYFYDDSAPQKLERGRTDFLDGGVNSYALDAEAFGGKSCGGNPTPTPTVTPTPTPPPESFSVSCPNPNQSTRVNRDVTFSVSISGGDAPYTISWSGTDDLSGSGESITKSYSNRGTKTATATVRDSQNRTATATCQVEITRSSGGGGGSSSRKPDITLTQKVEEAPLAQQTVYLSQVPYTGVTSYPKFALFILGLMFWSAVISAFLLYRSAKKNKKDARLSAIIESAEDTKEAGKALEFVMDEKAARLAKLLREEAEMFQVKILEGAVKAVIIASEGDVLHAKELVRSVSKQVRKTDGTMALLDAEKVREILFTSYLNLIPQFTEALFKGNEETVFNFLHAMKLNGYSVKDFMWHVVAELKAMSLRNSQNGRIIEMIAILSGGVTHDHRASFISAKLSLLKALRTGREA